MRAVWLVDQLWFIVPVASWKNRASSKVSYKKEVDYKFLWFISL